MTHFQSFINKKSLLRRINSIIKWPSLKKLKTSLFYRISIRILFWYQNWSRRDIVTKHIFFNDRESIVNYLAQKKPEFSYTHVPAFEVTAKRCEEAKPLDIKNYMRHHMMVFETGKNVILKEYLCECDACRRFEFGKCENKDSEAKTTRSIWTMKNLKEITMNRLLILSRFQRS